MDIVDKSKIRAEEIVRDVVVQDNRKRILLQVLKLSIGYDVEITEERLLVYGEALEDIAWQCVQEACKEIVKDVEIQRFPLASTIRERCLRIARSVGR